MLKNERLRILAITLILCIIYSIWLSPLKPVQIANLKILDIFFYLSSKLSSAPKAINDVVLVTIDDESLREMKMQWPWPRSVVARLIAGLSKGSPALISMDLVFAGKSVDPKDDLALIGALEDAKNVFAAAYFGSDGKYVIPDEPIALSLKEFGFVNKPRDADNGIRRMRPYIVSSSGKLIDYSLSLKVASFALNLPPANLALQVPLSREGLTYIKFFGSMNKFVFVPSWKIILNRFDTAALKNKLIFIGATSESFHDTYHTPLGMMPGLAIGLNEALTYLNKSFYRFAGRETNAMILFVFVLIAVYGGLRLPILHGMALAAVEMAAFIFLGLLLILHRIIIDSFGPIFLVLSTTVFTHGTRYALLVIENIGLKKEAVTDGLTGLYLYKYFETRLKRELKAANYMRKDLALVIYDIDHFKNINDAYGHEFGNGVLRTIAKRLKHHSRKNDIMARYGGEEFCIIVRGMKPLHAVKYAERLRDMVGSLEFKAADDRTVKVTMSAGIVTIDDAVSAKSSDFVKAADLALYKSKNAGRNRITVFNKR